MPLPVIADVFRCALNWSTSGGASAVNVMHIRLPGSISDDVNNLIESSVAADMWNTVSNDCDMNLLEITPLDGTTATSSYVKPHVSQWSGHGSAAWVAQVATVVKWPTVVRGRSHQGRTFLPFTGEGQIDNGRLAAGVVGAVQTAWDTFRDDIIVGGGSVVVASYKLASATDVDLPVVETALATQRRRQSRLRP